MTPEQPFVGLDAFDADMADYFPARVRDARVIASNVLARPVTVLYGGSGVGKSSLLNAGLPRAIRAVRQENDEDDREMAIHHRDKWSDPGATLAWLRDRVAEAVAAPEDRLILILDQFEEYFLYRDAEAFEWELAGALASQSCQLRVLISLRDDGLYLLDQLRRALPGLLTNRLELRQLDEESVRKAIEEPVATFNQRHGAAAMTIAPGFTDALIRQLRESVPESGQRRHAHASEQNIELPYLQLALHFLWNAARRSDRDMLDLALLEENQGVAGIVGNHVAAVLSRLSPGERYFAALAFHYLVTPSGGKFAYAPADLASNISNTERPVEEGPIAQLLAKLSGNNFRLLRETGGRYELFHDALAKPILEWRDEQTRSGAFALLIDASNGEVHTLGSYGQLFGRASATGRLAAFASRTVSRNHLVILKTGDLLDLRSRYGTTVNAVPLTHGETAPPLTSGDVICLANTAIMTFHWISDANELGGPAPHEETAGWGYLIDGHARRVTRLRDPLITLGLGDDGSISVSPAGTERPFARLHNRGGSPQIEATTDIPLLSKVDRRDAYKTEERPLAAGEVADLVLTGYNPSEAPTPDTVTVSDLLKITMAHVEFARRGVFRIGDTPFEIAADITRW